MPEQVGVVSNFGLNLSPAERQIDAFANWAEKRLVNIKGLQSNGFTRPLGQISGSLNEFEKSLAASNARVLAFGASAGIIYQLSSAFGALIESTVGVEKSLKDIDVILGLSSANMKTFRDSLFGISRDTAQSITEVTKAATEFSRQGLGMEETLTRTRDALILTRLTGLDAVASMESLTAAVNTYADSALTTTDIINKMATVDAAFAVSSADLAEALKRVGSTAKDAGVDINQLFGIITSVQQTTTRGGAVIGNALKTIFSRITTPEAVTQLKQLGIEVRDVEGKARPTLQVMSELANKIDDLSDAEQSQIERTIGSVYQINILKAALGDLSKEYSVYNKATELSANATDAAIARNKELNTTLDALIKQTKTNLTQIGSTIGNATINPVADKFLRGFNDMLEGIQKKDTTDIGSIIGRGIVNGIGEFISGPGAILVGGILVKLVSKFSADVAKGFTSLLSLNQGAKEQEQIQQKINQILSQNPGLVTAVFDKTNQLVSAEEKLHLVQQAIVQELRQENVERARALELSQKIASMTVASGQKNVIIGNIKGKTASAGFIPNRQSTELDHVIEKVGAREGGYQPGQIREIYVKGMGDVVYNSNERIRDFGFGQPAIMPPETSQAGKNYRDKFIDTHGFDPYKTKSKGLVPNYARLADKYRVIDARGYVKPSETMGVGLNSYVHAMHADDLAAFKGESLEDLIEYLMHQKPTVLEDIMKKGFIKPAAKGLVPNFGLYHRELGFPKEVQERLKSLAGKTLNLSHGPHARNAMLDDIRKYGKKVVPIPQKLSVNPAEVVEVETGTNLSEIVKILVRRKGEQGLDQIMALAMNPKDNAYIKTVWHNATNDKHNTLNASRYTPVAAQGLIPNYLDKDDEMFVNANKSLLRSRKTGQPLGEILGTGVAGAFVDTKKKLAGTKVGVKAFLSTPLAQNSLRREYKISEALAKAGLPEIIQVPKVFGSLPRSLSRLRLGKEVINGLTANQLYGALPTKYETKTDKVLAALSLHVEDSIRAKGIEPKDLHGDNYMLNNVAVEEFKALIKDPKKHKEFMSPKNRGKIYDSIAQKGGRVALVDVGEFRQQYATGLVPNYAKMDLFRGVGGTRLDVIRRANQNQDVPEELKKQIIFSAKPRSQEMGDLLNQATAFGLDEAALNYFLRNHQVGQNAGLVSTSKTKMVADVYAHGENGRQNVSQLSFPENRVLNPQKLKKLVTRFGREKVGKILHDRAQGKGKAIGFDMNEFMADTGFDSSGYVWENEVALLSKGLIPNYANKLSLRSIPNATIKERLAANFKKGADYKDFYNIATEASGLNKEDLRAYANIASALSPQIPEYRAAEASLKAFVQFKKTGSTKIEDYFNIPLSDGKNLSSLGLFGKAGVSQKFDKKTGKYVFDKNGKPVLSSQDGARRVTFSKALSGQELGAHDYDKTRHYAQALAGDPDAFPIDTNVLRTVFGKTKIGTLKAPDARRLIRLARETAAELGIEPRQLQAAVFKGANERFSDRYTPEFISGHFAALREAVTREAGAGIPRSAIRVDSSSKLKSQSNPLGLGVYNTQDEPYGLGQGINRALSQGLNPKTHGASQGLIPNFADKEFEFTPKRRRALERNSSTIIQNGVKYTALEVANRDVNSELNTLKARIREGSISQENANKAVQEMAKTYSLSVNDAKRLGKSIDATARSQKATEKAAKELAAKPPGKIAEILTGNSSRATGAPYDPTRALVPGRVLNGPASAPFDPTTALVPQRVITGTPPTPNYRTHLEYGPNPLLGPSQADFFRHLRSLDTGIAHGPAESDYLNHQNKLQQGFKAAGTFSSLIPFTNERALANYLKKFNPEGFQDARNQLTSRLSTASFGLSFAAPIVSNIAQEAIGKETQTQRTAGATVGAIGNTVSFAAAGAPFGGVGLAVGAGLGIASSLPQLIESITSELPEFERALENVKHSVQNEADAITGFLKTNETITAAKEGKTKISPENFARLTQERLNFFAQLSPERGNKLGEAKSAREQRELAEKFLTDDINKAKAAEAQKILKEFEYRAKPLTFQASPLEDDTENIIGRRTIPTVTEFGTGFETPVYGKKLKEEDRLKFQNQVGLALGSVDEGGKSFLQTLIEDPEFAEKLRGSVGTNGRDFFQRLNVAGQTRGNVVLEQIAKPLAELKDTDSNKELLNALSKLFGGVIDPDRLQKIRDRNSFEDSKISKRTRTAAKFEDAILDASNTISRFQSAMEAINDLNLIKVGGRIERERISDDNTLNLRQFDTGALDLEKLRNEAALKAIEGRFQLNQEQAKATSNNALTGLISESSVSFLKKRFNSTIGGEEGVFDLSGAQKKAFEFFNIGKFVDEIRKINADPKRDPADAIKVFGDLKQQTSQQINQIGENLQKGVGDKAENKDQLGFLYDVKLSIDKIYDDYFNSVRKLISAKEEETKATELAAKGREEVIKKEKLLAIGGGPEGILGGSRALPSVLSDIGFLASQDANLPRTQGLLKTAELAKSFGAEISDTLREELTEGLAEELEKSAKVAGKIISKASARKVASTQVNAKFAKGDGSNIIDFIDAPNNRFVANAPDESQVREHLRRISTDEDVTTKSIETTLKAIERLRTQNLDKGKSSLQTEREIERVLADQIKLLSDEAYLRNEISGKQLQQAQAAKSAARIEDGSYGLKDTLDDFNESFKYNFKDFQEDVSSGARELGSTLKSSFKDAFKSFADGSKSAKDAFRDFGLSVLGKITDKTTDIAIDTLFSVGQKGFSYALGRNQGGPIKRFSTGGKVNGGSGMRDDIPALLTDGEYVLKRSAVNRIGEDRLNYLNDGGVAVRFNNRFDYDDVKNPTRGTRVVDSILSAEALDDPNNPQNRIRDQMEEDLANYLSEKTAYEDNKTAANKAYRRSINQALISAYISAATTVGGAYVAAKIPARGQTIGGGAGGAGYTAKGTSNNFGGWGSTSRQVGSVGPAYAAQGGIIHRKYAVGGEVFGGTSATDNVPAMLTGGEFVVRKDVVQKHGIDFFNKLNRGRISGYATGGLVGTDAASTSGAGLDNLSESITRLIAIAENINSAVREKSEQTNSPTDESSKKEGKGAVNNYFSFEIKIDKNGGVESAPSQGGNEQGRKDNSSGDGLKKFSELVKNECVKLIIKEQRPGGLLSDQNKR